MQRPFIPKAGAATKRITAATGTANISIGLVAPNDVVRIYNAGSAIAYVAFGDSTVTATVPTAGSTAGSMPCGSGITEVQGIGLSGATIYGAAITASSTADLYFTLGDGI